MRITKIVLGLIAASLTSCLHITAPLASTANIVHVYKIQVGETGDMYGADLKEIAKGNKQEGGDIKVPPGGG